MRRVNLRFILATIVIVAVTAGAVHGVHTLQYKRHAGAWKNLAEAARKKADTQQQIDYLRRYTSLEKSDVKAYEDLGTLLVESKRFREAQLPLATALSAYEADGKAEDVLRLRRELVKVALNSGRWSDADEQLDLLITDIAPDVEDKDQAEYREQRARCRIPAGKWAEAVEQLERAIGHDRTRCDAYGLLAEIEASELNQAASAVEWLHTMVARNSDSVNAYSIRSGFRLSHASDLPVAVAEAAQLRGGSGVGMDAEPLPLLEMVKLAAADARQALALVADDPAALEVSMRSEHLLSKLLPDGESQQPLQEAERIAHQVLARAQADLDQKVAEYKEKHAPAGDGAATGEAASPAPGTTPAAGLEVPPKVLKQMTREAFFKAVPAYNVLADTLIQAGKPEEAVAMLTDGLSKVENDETLVLNLLSLKLAMPDQGADVERLLNILGQRRETKPLEEFLRARQKIVQGDHRAAMRELEAVLPSLERWPQAMQDAKLGIAACQLQSSYFQVAERLYREVLQSDPSSLPARWGLAVALDQQGRGGAAYPLYMDIVAARGVPPSDPSFPEIFVRIAHAMIARNLQEPPESEGWRQPLELVATGRSQVAAMSPGSVPPAVLDTLDITEAELFVARKDPESAIRMLTSAIERNPQSMALWIALIAVHDSTEQWNAALETIKQAQAAIGSNEPAKAAQLKLSEGLHLLYEMSSSIRSESANGATLPPAEVEARVGALKAKVVALIDTLPEPGAIEGRARQQYIHVLQRFADLCLTLGDTATAARLYDGITQLDNNHLLSYAARLELALVRKEQAIVEGLLTQIERIDGRKGPMWNFAQATLLALNAETKKELSAVDKRKMLSEAESCLRVAESSWPGMVRVRRLRSFVYRRQDRLTDAVDLDLQIFRDGFATPDFVNLLVQDLYALQRYDEAAQVLTVVDQDVADELVGLAPTAMEMSGTVRDAQQSQKLRNLAIELTRANAEEKADFRSRLAHGLMLLRGDDPAGARAEFESARDMAPDEAEPWIALIELDVKEGKVDSAKQLLERAEQSIRESDRAIALARGYDLVNEPERAQQFMQQALAAVPEDLSTATPLQAQILARAAEAYLQRAQREEAQARQLADQPEEAAKYRQAAVALDAEGTKLLERIVKDGSRALTKLAPAEGTADDAATGQARDALRKQLTNQIPVVRRRLALGLLAKGGTENREAALRLVEGNLVGDTFRAEDGRLYAILLSQSPNTADKQKALTEVKKLITGGRSAPRDEDRLLAATLHLSEYQRLGGGRRAPGAEPQGAAPQVSAEAQRHLEEARTLMREIVVMNDSRIKPSDDAAQTAISQTYVQALVGMIEILLMNGETSDAEFYVGRLTQAAPESQTAASAAAMLQFEKGEVDGAVEALRRFAAAGPDTERAGRQFAMSQLLETFGQRAKEPAQAARYFEAAEQMLSELSAGDRHGELLLAGFRARRGRVAEAIAAIEASATKASDVQLTSASVHAMRAAGTDTAMLDRLTAALEVGLVANPRSVPLRLMLADLQTWIGRADAAEVLYREVLAANPKHGAAANNLAFLLASQGRNLDESLALINGVIAEQGAIAELLDTRAYVYTRRNEAAKAIVDLTVAVTANNQPTYLYHLVEARVAMKQTDEAKATWKLAQEAGLVEATLHPLERAKFRELEAQLSSN